MSSSKGEVEMENKARDVWLVKVPVRIANLWDNLASDPMVMGDQKLGSLRVYQQKGGGHRLTFHVTPPEGETKKPAILGNDFSLQFNKMTEKMNVFSRGDGGVKVEGAVEQRFFMQPLSTNNYKQAVASRASETSAHFGVIKEINSWEGMSTQGKLRVIPMDSRSDDEEEGMDSKRRKITPDADGDEILRSKIFELFASKDREGNKMEHWALKDIKREMKELSNSDNQLTRVRDILKTICDFHKSGDYAKCYSLKAEYRG